MMPISRTTSALDAALERYAAQRTIAGGSLLVQLHGEDIYYHDCGYMDAEAKRAPARGDVYRIFSMTKPITMTALLQLCERGALRLTDRVADYFPEFAATPVLYRNAEGELVCEEQHTPITLLHLCTMTSGLPYPGKDSPAAKVMQRLADELPDTMPTVTYIHEIGKRGALCFQPGAQWMYGYSHDVLGAVIELVSGQRFSAYLREHIFDPVGMPNTGFVVPSAKRASFAALYRQVEDGFRRDTDPALNEAFLSAPAFESGGAGIVSTIDDYAAFCRALARGGACANGRILSEASVADMARDRLNDAQRATCHWWPRGYGYGVGVRTMVDPQKRFTTGSIGEFGWDGMAGTWMAVDPKRDMTMVFMQQMVPIPGPDPVGLSLMPLVYELIDSL